MTTTKKKKPVLNLKRFVVQDQHYNQIISDNAEATALESVEKLKKQNAPAIFLFDHKQKVGYSWTKEKFEKNYKKCEAKYIPPAEPIEVIDPEIIS